MYIGKAYDNPKDYGIMFCSHAHKPPHTGTYSVSFCLPASSNVLDHFLFSVFLLENYSDDD